VPIINGTYTGLCVPDDKMEDVFLLATCPKQDHVSQKTINNKACVHITSISQSGSCIPDDKKENMFLLVVCPNKDHVYQ